MKEKNKTEHMDLKKSYTGEKFRLLIDMCSMADQAMHGSGTCIVNSTDESSWKSSGAPKVLA